MFRPTYLAFVLAAASSISGATYIWQGGNTGDPTDLSEPLNWNPATVPSSAGDIAQFDAAGSANQPSLNTLLTLSNILFPSAAPAYTFQFSSAFATITCDNGGIVNQSGLQQTLELDGGTLTLNGNSPNSSNVIANLSNSATLSLTGSGTTVLNIANNDGTGVLGMGNSTLVVGSGNNSTTYAGTLNGSGILNKIGTGQLTLTGITSDAWSTTINQGTLSIAEANSIGTGTITFSPGTTTSLSSQLQVTNDIVLSNSIQIGPGFTAEVSLTDSLGTLTFDGSIADTSSGGNLFLTNGTFLLSGANTLSGTTTLADSTTVTAHNNNALSPHSPLVANGSLRLTNGATDYPNEIFSLTGIGTINTGNVGSGSLTIGGNANTEFSGQLLGNGAFNLNGGKLALTGNSSAYTGSATVAEGATLKLNGNLGGALTIQSESTLQGTGTVKRLTVANGGTISPGNSIGTLTVTDAYTQAANSTYFVEINAAGQSDLIQVTNSPGTATLNGGTVFVSPLGGIDFGTKYTILSTTGGVTGQFANVLTANPSSLFIPSLSYDLNNVFLTIQSSLVNGAVTFNERQVATQLDSLTGDPDAEVNALLNALVGLSPTEIIEALDQLTGDPYTKDAFLSAGLNRQFIRRLYDPIRSIVTTSPFCRCCVNEGIKIWGEAGWNRSFLRNDGNAFGFNAKGWELTVGAQTTFCDLFTVGLAGSYAHDFIHYNVNSTGKIDSGFLGIYSLYRPEEFYVLADLAFGYSNNRVHRTISAGSFNVMAKGSPDLYDLTFYGEAGFDIHSTWVLVQPFIGLEASGNWRSCFTEHGAGDLDLRFGSRNCGNATGRLGLHVTTEEICNFSLSLDGAWNHRLTSDHFLYNEAFAGFGTPFVIKGTHLNRNSAEGAVTITSQITPSIKGWGEFSGEVWRNASNYFLAFGIQANF